ncbi:MAG: hypothetical protein HQK53_16945, partial [Oligoflexia bacterium]|nr:hypothetical protein [Oligoflexia bacterium]
KDSAAKKLVVLIKVGRDDGLDDLLPLINKLLNEKDYTTLPPANGAQASSSTAPYNLELNGKLLSEEQPINVPGFKRFRFSLHLQFQNSKGEKISTSEHSVTKSARNYQLAYDQALAELRSFLQKEWEELSVE